jgi:hypothetical protein
MHGYQNIGGGSSPAAQHSGIHVKPVTYQELNQAPLSFEASPLAVKDSPTKAKKVAALVLGASIFALAGLSSSGPSTAVLGGSHAWTNATGIRNGSLAPNAAAAPAVDDAGGYCCHYATDKADACGTCLAPGTTGHCAASALNCSGCGGDWCHAPTPAPTPAGYVAPPHGICCHYATDKTDVCGTCLAPDRSSCGTDVDACAACGGSPTTAWCAELTAPKADLAKATAAAHPK